MFKNRSVVRHSKYGVGIVTHVFPNFVRVYFEDKETRDIPLFNNKSPLLSEFDDITIDELIYKELYTVLFNPQTINRGSSYANDGRVSIKRAVDDEIAASVEGEYLEYDVYLMIKDNKINMSCTCPVNGSCKHQYATFLTRKDEIGKVYQHATSPKHVIKESVFDEPITTISKFSSTHQSYYKAIIQAHNYLKGNQLYEAFFDSFLRFCKMDEKGKEALFYMLALNSNTFHDGMTYLVEHRDNKQYIECINILMKFKKSLLDKTDSFTEEMLTLMTYLNDGKYHEAIDFVNNKRNITMYDEVLLYIYLDKLEYDSATVEFFNKFINNERTYLIKADQILKRISDTSLRNYFLIENINFVGVQQEIYFSLSLSNKIKVLKKWDNYDARKQYLYQDFDNFKSAGFDVDLAYVITALVYKEKGIKEKQRLIDLARQLDNSTYLVEYLNNFDKRRLF